MPLASRNFGKIILFRIESIDVSMGISQPCAFPSPVFVSMSAIEICTKPLARRTLSRVRGRQVVWDDTRARLQVIICVCA